MTPRNRLAGSAGRSASRACCQAPHQSGCSRTSRPGKAHGTVWAACLAAQLELQPTLPGSSGTAAHWVSIQSNPGSWSGGGGGNADGFERRRTPVYSSVGTPSRLTAPHGRGAAGASWVQSRQMPHAAAKSVVSAGAASSSGGWTGTAQQRAAIRLQGHQGLDPCQAQGLAHSEIGTNKAPASPAQQPDQQPSASGPPGLGRSAGGRRHQRTRSSLTTWPHTWGRR